MPLRGLYILLMVPIFLFSSCEKKLKLSCEEREVSKIGMNHFQPLVFAMEKYKSDNGHYPMKDIFLLTPKYIDKIPLIPYSTNSIDESKFNVLRNQHLESGSASVSEDGSSFSIKFYPKDDRVCLTGSRNNVCEYTSDKKQWGCYQH